MKTGTVHLSLPLGGLAWLNPKRFQSWAQKLSGQRCSEQIQKDSDLRTSLWKEG